MCLRQSCSLANSCIQHLDLEYDSGFVTTTLQLRFYRRTREAADRRMRRNVSAPVVASLTLNYLRIEESAREAAHNL